MLRLRLERDREPPVSAGRAPGSLSADGKTFAVAEPAARRLSPAPTASLRGPVRRGYAAGATASGGVRRRRKETSNAEVSIRPAMASTPFQWSIVQAVPASGPAIDEPA
jgi:hypothetical protein